MLIPTGSGCVLIARGGISCFCWFMCVWYSGLIGQRVLVIVLTQEESSVCFDYSVGSVAVSPTQEERCCIRLVYLSSSGGASLLI